MSTRWTTAEAVRRMNGFPLDTNDPNYAEDLVLHYYVDRAQEAVASDVSILVRDEQTSGSINGTNTYFFCTNKPIADWNFDKVINTLDVTVYGWGSLEDLNTKTSLSVSAIDYLNGRITMSSAPSSTFEVLTIDYRHSKYEINFTLLDVATAYMAGWLYLTAEYMEMPTTTRVGAQGFRFESSPPTNAWNAYLRTMDRIRHKIIVSGKKTGMKLKSI